MSTALAKNASRNVGEIKKISLDSPPSCTGCNRPMGICKRATVKLVGLDSTYQVSIPTYGCRKNDCPQRMKNLITPPNPFAAPRMTYDFAVQGEVTILRWHEHCTHKEISERMKDRFEISIDHYAIETILKSYEIACAKTYRQSTIDQMHQHHGALICVDVMEPLKGKNGLLVAHEYWTGLTLGVKKMPNGKTETYEAFFRGLRERLEVELGIPIIGIISDAHPTQRKAIAKIFEDIPHCICHYHFYNYVIRDAKLADSGIVTQIRATLRKNYDIKQFNQRCITQTIPRSQYEVLQPLFEPIVELSNWSRKPRDPCFTGLELCHRLTDITEQFQLLKTKVDDGVIQVPKHSRKVVNRFLIALEGILATYAELIKDLEEIQMHLTDLVDILAQTEYNASGGLKKMLQFSDNLRFSELENPRDGVASLFVKELVKYIETKGKLLFNYRTIPGAPTTNNFQELKFKQLKHFLRRVIGHGAAKDYLMVHGERILFVNPRESRDKILAIFKNCNQHEARKEIKANRRSMERWAIVMHNRVRWEDRIQKLHDYICGLEMKPIKRV